VAIIAVKFNLLVMVD